MHRRRFLTAAALAPAGVALSPSPIALALTARQAATPGDGPYGPLGDEPDENGLLLPEGFTSRVVATVGEPVGDTDYVLRGFLDGGAVIPADDGGWFHVRNHELLDTTAGVSALRFDADGELVDAYSILDGTIRNCAGGVSPWGSWLSCEEIPDGRVWDCDPTGEREAVAIDAMGRFMHEAVAFDPERGHWYLTEDIPTGRFYRYTPPDASTLEGLDGGVLEAAVVAGDGAVTWETIDDPSGASAPTSEQAGASMPFNGGEGIWYDATADRMLFTTKGDDRVWSYDLAAEILEVVYDAAELDDPPLTGVDNIVVAANGDAYVAEDGGDMEVVLLTPDGVVARFLKMTAEQDQSEVTGPCFSPDGTRLYVASFGYTLPGRIFEITGPFREAGATDGGSGSTTTLAAAGSSGGDEAAGASDDGDEGSSGAAVAIGAGAVLVAGGVGAVVALRRRGAR